MMARSPRSNQRPDTLMQDRSPPARRNHLQRAAGPYSWVKLRRTQCEQMSSGLPLKADIARCCWHVAFVPNPEVFNGLGHVPLAQWMSAVRSRHRLPPPGRAMRAYQTSGHLPVAVPHAFVLIRPTIGVSTSAPAICGLILTSRRVCHCFCR